MDDGSVNHLSNGAITSFNLATNGFTIEECNQLCSILYEKFNLVCTVQMEKGTPKIYISAKSKDLFLSLVSPYIHPHFNYKISPRPEGFEIVSKDGIGVIVLDTQGNPIEGSPFLSLRDAARNTGITHDSVRRGIDKNVYINGFQFKLVNPSKGVIKIGQAGDSIEVLDINLIPLPNSPYISIREMCRDQDFKRSTIMPYIKSGELYRGMYYFKRLGKV